MGNKELSLPGFIVVEFMSVIVIIPPIHYYTMLPEINVKLSGLQHHNCWASSVINDDYCTLQYKY